MYFQCAFPKPESLSIHNISPNQGIVWWCWWWSYINRVDASHSGINYQKCL